MLNSYLQAHYDGKSNEENVVLFGNKVRVTVLTERVIRVEHSENGIFEDAPSQMIVNRNTPKVSFESKQFGNELFITTNKAVFKIKDGAFVGASFDGGKTFVVEDEKQNLKGTRRTLDQCRGACKLDKGLMSKNGVTTIDDSESLLFADTGEIIQRTNKEKDVYVFVTTEYNDLLHDFYLVSGKQPMLPRYVFGNWWSRYYAYTQKEYIELMQKFRNENVPLSVSVIDMDWHYTYDFKYRFPELYKGKKIPFFYQRSLTGWTGYTFNRDLIPEPGKFLSDLHDMGLKTTLNLHPAQGVFPHEDAFPAMSKKLPTGELGNIEFNFASTDFINSYFDDLHKPLERMGVDFWWMDWQQGTKTALAGLDPLFALNHYHFLENSEEKRGLLFSRYSKLGSQRYPIGFSGDTYINYKILDFIPYFTANAANAAYPLWSHDIGGHMGGIKDDELYTRWIELGAFLPINRLHSTNNFTTGKEPWMANEYADIIAKRYLRLRHKMVPYIYSEHVNSIDDGYPVCAPLYYYYDGENAFKYRNSYMFGRTLFVMPMTHKADENVKLSVERCWLPEGEWFDLFERRYYANGENIFARSLSKMPVLMRKGSILPLNYDYFGTDNPKSLEVVLTRGNGEYELYEDDGESYDYKNGKTVITRMTVAENANGVKISVNAEGDLALVPQNRTFVVKPVDIDDAKEVVVNMGGEEKRLERYERDGKIYFAGNESELNLIDERKEVVPSLVEIILADVPADKPLNIELKDVVNVKKVNYYNGIIELISRANGNNGKKNMACADLMTANNKEEASVILKKSKLPKDLKLAIEEVISIAEFSKDDVNPTFFNGNQINLRTINKMIKRQLFGIEDKEKK